MTATTALRSLPRRVAALLIVSAIPAACGLPADDQVTTYNADELPDVLANTTTTSTSTTTTTLAPPSTASIPADASTTSSSVPAVATTRVEVFYTLGFSDGLQPINLNLPFEQVTLPQLTSVLETPPAELTSFNLRSSVRPGLIGGIVPDRGTATVELSQEVLNRMTSSQVRRSIAQIVLTLTSFVTPNDGAIGQVRFTVDGEPIPVFLPADGGDSEPGEPVAYSDFGVLVTPITPTSTTTPGSTTIASTAVATSIPAPAPPPP